MNWIIIKPQLRSSFERKKVRLATIEGRPERLEARLAELDMNFEREIQTLKRVATSARKRFLKHGESRIK